MLPLVLVSNKNIYIDIKPYFCLLYGSILKYWSSDHGCFPRELPNSFASFSSFPKRRYGVFAVTVSEI